MKQPRLRRLLQLCLLACLVLAGGACTPEAPPAKRVGIVLFGASRQPQVDGFIAGLRELGYEDGRNIRYEIRNAGGARQAIPGLVEELRAAKVDLLMAAGGHEADDMKKAHEQAPGPPVVVCYINSMIERGLIKNRREPGWPVTGVDNLNAELSGKRIELLRDLLPGVRRVLVFYQESVAPSQAGMQLARATGARFGIEIIAHDVADREALRRGLADLRRGAADAILTVPNAMIDNAFGEILLPQARALGLPVFGHEHNFATAGALASYGAPFFELGRQAARLADKILTGTPAQRMPFETPLAYRYVVNRDTAAALGVEIGELARSQIDELVPAER